MKIRNGKCQVDAHVPLSDSSDIVYHISELSSARGRAASDEYSRGGCENFQGAEVLVMAPPKWWEGKKMKS